MWYDETVIYQIYPLGMCGAPPANDGVLAPRLGTVQKFIPHMKKLGADTVLFNPLFESDAHGYDTRDYRACDVRLGTNEDLKKLFVKLHKEGFRVLLDGVFNHVGRGFFAFRDVCEKRDGSAYKDWFYIDFGGNSPYNDGFWYEGWEGHFELVKLNLDNPAVADYLIESVKFWIDEFGIDGLRLDVAYMVNRNFLMRLRHEVCEYKKDFFLFGEILHGDYRQIMNDEMCHSATNYECYKGLYSAVNSNNLFEIAHSLQRQFGNEQWCLYTGKNLISFADNHDVSRLATIITDERKLPAVYTLLFTMPGIPAVYYGSEWAIRGDKAEGDRALRPEVKAPEWNELTDHIAALAEARKTLPALQYGSFSTIVLSNTHCLFERRLDGERVLVAANIAEEPCVIHADFQAGRAKDMISGQYVDFGGGLEIPGFTTYVLVP